MTARRLTSLACAIALQLGAGCGEDADTSETSEALEQVAMARDAGGNVFADLSQLAPPVTIEAVIAHDPDVILSTDDTIGDPAALWRRWSGMKAVKAGSIYSMSSDTLTRSTPRLAVGAGEVCAALDDARRK